MFIHIRKLIIWRNFFVFLGPRAEIIRVLVLKLLTQTAVASVNVPFPVISCGMHEATTTATTSTATMNPLRKFFPTRTRTSMVSKARSSQLPSDNREHVGSNNHQTHARSPRLPLAIPATTSKILRVPNTTAKAFDRFLAVAVLSFSASSEFCRWLSWLFLTFLAPQLATIHTHFPWPPREFPCCTVASFPSDLPCCVVLWEAWYVCSCLSVPESKKTSLENFG